MFLIKLKVYFINELMKRVFVKASCSSNGFYNRKIATNLSCCKMWYILREIIIHSTSCLDDARLNCNYCISIAKCWRPHKYISFKKTEPKYRRYSILAVNKNSTISIKNSTISIKNFLVYSLKFIQIAWWLRIFTQKNKSENIVLDMLAFH